jgi:hypothetical protein
MVLIVLIRKLRQKDASKFHIQLCLAMLFMLIVSFVLVVYSAQGFPIIYEGCVAISVLVHYFTLASVMWMGAEALLMFKKLVMVFKKVTAKFIVSVSFVCWSTYAPFIIYSRSGTLSQPPAPPPPSLPAKRY